MTRRDLCWRMLGLALLASSAGTSLLHRALLDAVGRRPAVPLEMALALSSFLFASLGVLLLCQGVRLHDSWSRDLRRRRAARDRDGGGLPAGPLPLPVEDRVPAATFAAIRRAARAARD